jgi:hypothetical protein
MAKITDLEQKGLIDALGIEEKDLFEAGHNLIGFYSTLYKINERLKREGKPCI